MQKARFVGALSYEVNFLPNDDVCAGRKRGRNAAGAHDGAGSDLCGHDHTRDHDDNPDELRADDKVLADVAGDECGVVTAAADEEDDGVEQLR